MENSRPPAPARTDHTVTSHGFVPCLLIAFGGLTVAAVIAAQEWMARELADERIVLPLVLYRELWILNSAAAAGMAMFIAGAAWMPAPARRRRNHL